MNTFTLSDSAIKAHKKANQKGIKTDSIAEIVRIVLDQEIVSYCSSKGCISFDVDDLVEGGRYA